MVSQEHYLSRGVYTKCFVHVAMVDLHGGVSTNQWHLCNCLSEVHFASLVIHICGTEHHIPQATKQLALAADLVELKETDRHPPTKISLPLSTMFRSPGFRIIGRETPQERLSGTSWAMTELGSSGRPTLGQP